jgi:hypothetical protein
MLLGSLNRNSRILVFVHPLLILPKICLNQLDATQSNRLSYFYSFRKFLEGKMFPDQSQIILEDNMFHHLDFHFLDSPQL